MRRIYIFSLVLALTALFLVSCSPAAPTTESEQPTNTPTNPPPPAPQTATIPPAPTAASVPTNEPTIAPTSSETASGFDGQAVLKKSCTACHSLDRVVNKKASADEWASTVNRMVNEGANLTADEQAALIQYLAENYK